MAMDVPERGSPETTTIGFPYRSRLYTRRRPGLIAHAPPYKSARILAGLKGKEQFP
jgi:hypothetical protein